MAGINPGATLVQWIERRSFFGRPTIDRRQQLTCQQAQSRPNYDYQEASCRVKAANTCRTPDVSYTGTSDVCVCATLAAYSSKFAACWADTPYSGCLDLRLDGALLATWSSGHCTTISIKSSSSSITLISSTPTPAPNTPTVPVPALSSSAVDTKPQSSPQVVVPQSSIVVTTTEPASTFMSSVRPPVIPNQSPIDILGQSTGDNRASSRTTSETTPASIPRPSFVSVAVATSAITESISGLVSTTSTHVALPRWTGIGALLREYCATPQYSMIDGPTAYWAPVVGCMGSKSDCCPFDIPPSASVVQAAVETNSVGASGDRGFPSALSPAQATLSRCPDDYRIIGDGCCPSNYFPWSTTFGGQTPCYSALPAATTPPPVSANVVAHSLTPTSAVVNVVYAIQYPLKIAPSDNGLAMGVKIGIGAGAGAIALIIGVITFLLVRKHKAHKRDKATLDEMSGIGSTRQSVAASSAFGGVKSWQKGVSVDVSSGLEAVPEPTLPQVIAYQQTHYPSDWRPDYRTVSPPVPLPGHYMIASIPSPPIREHSEVGSDSGFGSENRSELYGGQHGIQRQEMQGGHREWRHEGVAQQVTYYEAPAGRMTPRPGQYGTGHD